MSRFKVHVLLSLQQLCPRKDTSACVQAHMKTYWYIISHDTWLWVHVEWAFCGVTPQMNMAYSDKRCKRQRKNTKPWSRGVVLQFSGTLISWLQVQLTVFCAPRTIIERTYPEIVGSDNVPCQDRVHSTWEQSHSYVIHSPSCSPSAKKCEFEEKAAVEQPPSDSNASW